MTTEPETYLLDVNVMVALTNGSHARHQRAHEWFAQVDSWATTAMTEAAFFRLMMNPAVAGATRTASEIRVVLTALRGQKRHRFVGDETSLAAPMIDLAGLQGHQQVTDFHLVNLAANNGLVLATFDAKIKRSLLPKDRKHCVVV